MNLGAMVDVGVDPEFLKTELRKLKVRNFKLEFKSDQRKGITGTRAHVILTEKKGTLRNDQDQNQHHNEHHQYMKGTYRTLVR